MQILIVIGLLLQISQQDHKNKENDDNDNNQGESNGNTIKATQTAISEALIGDISNHRILSYQDKAPLPAEGYVNTLKVLYSSTKHGASTKKPSRYLPTSAERILDAPDIINDYYLQLLDWNSNNILAVALSSELYLWNATSGQFAVIACTNCYLNLNLLC
jgi:cell division cycle protein 20 (cofactor of APC complex)